MKAEQEKISAKVRAVSMHLNGGTHEYLVREYNKALAAQTTQPCNRACHGCGANHLLGGPCFDYSKDLV